MIEKIAGLFYEMGPARTMLIADCIIIIVILNCNYVILDAIYDIPERIRGVAPAVYTRRILETVSVILEAAILFQVRKVSLFIIWIIVLFVRFTTGLLLRELKNAEVKTEA